MFADPRLVVAESIQPLDQLEVAVQEESGVDARAMHGWKKDAESHEVTV
jgi:hypothetical protein